MASHCSFLVLFCAIVSHNLVPLTMTTMNLAGQQACVCRPTIASISTGVITLAVDKPLRGAMLDPTVLWRIDKDEVSSIFTRMRCNLMGKIQI